MTSQSVTSTPSTECREFANITGVLFAAQIARDNTRAYCVVSAFCFWRSSQKNFLHPPHMAFVSCELSLLLASTVHGTKRTDNSWCHFHSLRGSGILVVTHSPSRVLSTFRKIYSVSEYGTPPPSEACFVVYCCRG